MSAELPIFNRVRELRELDRAWDSGKPELLIAAGRRRAGKSYLLTHFLQKKRGFYYQATKGTAKDQLERLSNAVAVQFPTAKLSHTAGFRRWENFFQFMVEEAAGEPFLLILDEVPYLLKAIRGFGTLLQSFWDQDLPATQVKLVLSGSYISAMQRLTTADQPLHGRRTGALAFAPFLYRDAAAFVPGYSARDRIIAYGTFGGLPGQLALLDPAKTIAENVAGQMLNPAGRLADEAEHLFDAFLGDAGVHYSIVRAVASGERKWSKITSRIGKDSASLSRPLGWLQEMKVLDHVIPATDRPPGKPKKAIYRIADPYLAFWHQFVAMVRATGSDDLREPEELWDAFIAPNLDEYMGPVFEACCRAFVGGGQHPKLPFRPVRVGEWWSDDSQEEIDVVAYDASGNLLLGECKWGSVTTQDLTTLERRRDIVLKELTGVRRVHLALFAGNPLEDRGVAARVERGEVLHFTLEDLFV